jgi:hypothetical protein
VVPHGKAVLGEGHVVVWGCHKPLLDFIVVDKAGSKIVLGACFGVDLLFGKPKLSIALRNVKLEDNRRFDPQSSQDVQL